MEKSVIEKEDIWVHTLCEMCLGFCGVLVHRVDGVVVEIKGDPDCPISRGKICGKGAAAIMTLYDPDRVKTPLKRTNPEKGLGVDPKWVPISWDEALNILEEKLTKVRNEDPRKLAVSTFESWVLSSLLSDWAEAFGTPNAMNWHVYFCGTYLHSAMYMTNGSFHCDFDADHCNYLMLFGNQVGFMAGYNPLLSARKVAAARKRGMKVIAIDPICSNAAAKADEWVPIRPGTDAALVLAMLNVLLNEIEIYDREFIKKYTNGPYLIKPDGYYMRQDPKLKEFDKSPYLRRENKPLVWDIKDGKAKTHDDGSVNDLALEGSFEVNGVECKPAFQLLKDHVRKYTPEMASEITTIPAATIRRLAEEFGKQARIGSTITIDGVELPYRPVAANIYRGAGTHKHGIMMSLSMQTLNLIMGNFYVPGGHSGSNLVGPSWEWAPRQIDGLIRVASYKRVAMRGDFYSYEVKAPETMSLSELFPMTSTRASTHLLTSLNPEKYGLPYKPEVLLVCKRNLIRSGVNWEITAEALKQYKFIAAFCTQLDETAEFADLVLPETHSLEKLQMFPHQWVWSESRQTGYFYWSVRQPVVPPAGEARDWADVLLELAYRMGFLPQVYKGLNSTRELKEPYLLDPTRKYTNAEISDRRAKSRFGEEKGLDWFKEHGHWSRKRTVDEMYPLPWLKVRFPMYYELYLEAGEKVREKTRELGFEGWDVSDYQPLPDWKPCDSYTKSGEFDLISVNFRVPTHSQSYTAQNPWLCEVAELNPYAQKILINTETAARKGIRDGEIIWVESAVGKVKGKAKVTQCIHPEVVGMSSHFGGVARGMPVAFGKGTNQNNLLPLDLDPITTCPDQCVKVKIYSASKQGNDNERIVR